MGHSSDKRKSNHASSSQKKKAKSSHEDIAELFDSETNYFSERARQPGWSELGSDEARQEEIYRQRFIKDGEEELIKYLGGGILGWIVIK